jgi:predicted DNA-binding WGR domain protein
MIRLVLVCPKTNKNRFYRIQVVPGLFGNWALVREWGRIGQPGTVKKEWFESLTQAEDAKELILKQKLKRGYN